MEKYVLVDSDGSPVTGNVWSSMFRALYEKELYPQARIITINELYGKRHTNASARSLRT